MFRGKETGCRARKQSQEVCQGEEAGKDIPGGRGVAGSEKSHLLKVRLEEAKLS